MWKKISSRIVFNHPRMKLAEDSVELPDGTVVPYLRDADTNRHSVTLVCIDGDKVLVQKEYSYPPNQVLYQFPGGKVEQPEKIIAAGKRELIEESGLSPRHLQELGWYYVDNRRSNAKMHVLLAKNFAKREKRGGDAEEDIKSEWVTIADLEKMISDGEIVNYSMLAAWTMFRPNMDT